MISTFRPHRTKPGRWRGMRMLALTFLAGTSLATPALAQTAWTGTNSDNWTDTGNWDNGVPTAADDVTIDTTSPNYPRLNNAMGNAGEIDIGTATGHGVLQVENGATMNSGDVQLGRDAGSIGNLIISGPGTTWSSSSGMIAGSHGGAGLVVHDGANVTATSLIAGHLIGSTGAIILGAGATVTATAGVTIGQNGSGQMMMSGGATVSAGQAQIGAYATGSGEVHTADSALFAVTHGLTVGAGTTGTLHVSTGGNVAAGSAVIGWSSGGTGIGLVHDSSSRLAIGTDLVVGAWGTGELTLWDDGEVAAGGVLHLAREAGSLGTLNIGAASGQAANTTGTLSAGDHIQFGAGTGMLTFNHTNNAYSFAPQLQGSGTINQLAGTTTLTADSQGFSGLANVSGGKLIVTGRLGGTMDVTGGGTLGGTGQTGNVGFGMGGIAAPGNSIGTLTTTDVTFNAGSFFDVEVNAAGMSDLITATNTANLNGGTVRVSAMPDYALGTSYHIVHAANGLTGSFTDATTNLAFITPILTYDGNNAFLTLFQTANFTSAAVTPNQHAVATSLASLPTSNPIVPSILGLTVPQARQALDNLSGEGHASLRSVLLEDARMPREAAFDRLADDEEGLWAVVQASHLALASDGNAAALSAGVFDLAGGSDAYLGDWLVGLMLHAGATNLSIPDRATSGTIGDVGLGVYAGTDWENTALDLGLDLAWHGISTRRSFGFGRFADSLSADYGAATAQAFGRVSHDFALPQFVLRPYGKAAYVVTSTGGSTEAGGPAALAVAQGTSSALFTTLGIDVERELLLEDGSTLAVTAGIGWQHSFAETPTTSNTIAGAPPFTVAGARLPSDALVLEAGLGWQLESGPRLDLTYDGVIAGSGQTHAVKATLAATY